MTNGQTDLKVKRVIYYVCNVEKYSYSFQNVIRFWVGEMGIDGFRMDAVPFIYEDTEFRDEPLSNQSEDPNDYNYLNHTYTFNLPEHYDMIGQFNDILSEYELIDGHDRYR